MNITFKIRRRNPTGAASIPYRVIAADLHHPAVEDDFQGGAFPAGVVNFNDGDREKSVSVALADTAAPGHGFALTIANPPTGIRLMVPTTTGYDLAHGVFRPGRGGFWFGRATIPS